MPKKVDRIVTDLPAGLVPLLTQRELETFYQVSDWTVLQWIKQGLPVEPFANRGRRFDLARVQAWHAEREALAATA
ncbi:hypothetical protein IPZ58_07850 [Streptomyces roseoverticillatus]|uniref:terminase small subunit n=1 Tax=Streptomyces roseoverticillatus TaxID=66429 RepID=UPI001F194ABD|nr:terminase small subunit [Streptomyces roseoverticillatus]MCF3101492.1 hypothetical protein [Streptomyces roseoverticillatus]